MKHRDAAIHCEMKKYAFRQSKDGMIVSFVLHPQEIPKQLQIADIGSRWMVALVELADNETPVQPQPVKEHPESLAARDERGSWQELTPAVQAGIRCKDPVFIAFLKEAKDAYNGNIVYKVRELCNVKSRSELSTNRKAHILWHQLDEQFQAWKLTQ